VEHERELREFLVTATNSFGFILTEIQIGHFLFLLEQLLKWNATINLTSITDPYEIISKHFVDSLLALNAVNFPPHATVIDIGSGAGFPGIPLKIVRTDLHLVLIEPSQKKSSFLRAVVGGLKLENASIFSGTVEDYAAKHSEVLADMLVLRALRFDQIAEPSLRVLKPTGKLVLYGTEKENYHLSGLKTECRHEVSLPLNHGSRVLTVLSKGDHA
jgi:16S rRNA (guanine527-N7)-methyltransferase